MVDKLPPILPFLLNYHSGKVHPVLEPDVLVSLPALDCTVDCNQFCVSFALMKTEKVSSVGNRLTETRRIWL